MPFKSSLLLIFPIIYILKGIYTKRNQYRVSISQIYLFLFIKYIFYYKYFTNQNHFI
ncbi:MAG: hypothetical protein H6Q14_798 [Bacteroidetes bacterium]|nr:hypothetical protein [Bacteroidota bacterium]